MKPKKVETATCRSCGRVLKLHPKDDVAAALKRNRWSNIQGNTGVCWSCGKKGNR